MSNKRHCVMCSRRGHHQMRVRYASCNCDECNQSTPCPCLYKIEICLKSENVQQQKVRFSENNMPHNSDLRKPVQTRGLSDLVKELVEKCIFNYDWRPKNIHIRLTTKWRKHVDRNSNLNIVN